MTRKDTNVIGRREELSLLRELIAPPHKESHVLLLLGDPGLGKTVLLAEAAREARAAGMRVLATTGRESEQDLAFAGLHQLLRPVLDRVARLPTRQAEALRGAFGLTDDPAPPDALLTGIAVLTLLSELSDEQPLLVTADDVQWLDRASLDALAFAARRLESEQLVLLAGARGNVPPPVSSGTSRSSCCDHSPGRTRACSWTRNRARRTVGCVNRCWPRRSATHWH